jgi:serine/threonine-protein kinase
MIDFVRALQRYVLHDEIASGGMASVHLGMLRAGGGFARLVAIKVMHAQYAKDENFREMFLDEARIVARVRDPHVVSTLDILEEQNELFLVMDYVNGPSLAKVLKDLTKEEEQIPVRVAATIVMDLLAGLHAAHEARSETGEPLGVVHRDVSPHNVLIGSDGLSRVMDFGIATAADQLHLTQPGEVKGKVGYMPPEQALGRTVDRRADVYAAGMVLFEALTLRRPFSGTNFTELAIQHITEAPPRPSLFRSEISPELDGVILRAIAKKPEERFETALAMVEALDALGLRLPPREVADWLASVQRDFFQRRDAVVTAVSQADPADAQQSSVGADVTEAPTRVTVRETVGRASWAARGAVALLAASIGAAAFVGVRSRTGEPHVTSALASQGAPSVTPGPELGSAVVPTVSMGAVSTEVVTVPTPTATTIAHVSDHRPHPRPNTSASTSATVDAPLPDCCVGDLRVKVRGCRDNCPAGT